MKGLRARGSFFMGHILYGCSCQVVGSVADLHRFDADPDPSFQVKAQNLEKVLK
jgi:hypothetical protein